MQGQPDDSPYGSDARLWTYQFGVPTEIANPEVNPRLGRDLLVGDYLQMVPRIAGLRNDNTEEQNYQIIIEAARRYGLITTGRLEIIQ